MIEIKDERIENSRIRYQSEAYLIINSLLAFDLLYKIFEQDKNRLDILLILFLSNLYLVVRNVISGTYSYPSKKIPLKEILQEAFLFSAITTIGNSYINININLLIEPVILVISFSFWAIGRITLIKLSNKRNENIV